MFVSSPGLSHHCTGSASLSPLVAKLGHQLPSWQTCTCHQLELGWPAGKPEQLQGRQRYLVHFLSPQFESWPCLPHDIMHTLSQWLLSPLQLLRNWALHHITNLTWMHTLPNISSVLLAFPCLESTILIFENPLQQQQDFFALTIPSSGVLVNSTESQHTSGPGNVHPQWGLWLTVSHFHFLTSHSGEKKAFQDHWWQKLYKYLFKLQVFPLKSSGSQRVLFLWALAY